MKKQVVVIHGGDTFGTHDEYIAFLESFAIDSLEYFIKWGWKDSLQERLGSDYQVITPRMPNKNNAQYEEWKIWFEKLIRLLNNEVILVGHSLGGSFLAKYLSENKFPKKINGVFLVSAVFDQDTDGYGLATFALPEKLDLQTEHIFLYHSKDDPLVDFSALANFQKLLPQAHAKLFEDRKHITQNEFPELIHDIQSL